MSTTTTNGTESARVMSAHMARDELLRCIWPWYDKGDGSRMLDACAHVAIWPQPDRSLLERIQALIVGGMLPTIFEVGDKIGPGPEGDLLRDCIERYALEGAPPPPEEQWERADEPPPRPGADTRPPGWRPQPGEIVKALDMGNYGEVLEVFETEALVRFTAKNGNVREKRMSLDDLAPREPGDGGSGAGAKAADPYRESLRLLTLRDLEALPPPKWTVRRYVPADALTILYGQPGTCKSFVALDVALCVAAGIPWHGETTRQGRVVYAAGEGTGGMWRRVQAWGAYRLGDHLEAARERFLLVPNVPRLLDDGRLPWFLDLISAPERKPDLLIVDTVARSLLGGDENSAEDCGMAIESLDRIRRAAGCAVLAVHHAGKDASRGARGSSALLGGADCMLEITRGEKEKEIKLQVAKQKDAEPARPKTFIPEVVTLGPGTAEEGPVTSIQLRSQTATERKIDLTESTQKLLDLLSQPVHQGEGISARDAVSILGISRATFFRAANALLEEGKVKKRGARYLATAAGTTAGGEASTTSEEKE